MENFSARSLNLAHGLVASAVLLAVGLLAASAQEITVYNFKGSTSLDGSVPESTLIFDSAGNLYGTTTSGGAVNAPEGTYGTVFELIAGTGGTWTEKVLYSFGANPGDGQVPLAGLVFDGSGNLYGTTSLGGAHNGGTVYELSPGAGGNWTEKVLYSFGATTTDGTDPRRGGLIFDAAGNLYGTTLLGGGNTVSNGGGVETAGTVFELSPGGGGSWTEKVLYSFGESTTDAANSVAGVVFDAAGNLYGTTHYGGAYNDGTVFRLSPAAGGGWTEAVIHSFDDNGVDGSQPEAGLVFDTAGNLYGTTYGGGSNPSFGGLGAVFMMSPTGDGTWSEQVLFSFAGANGDYPLGGLAIDAAGNLYGTASSKLYGYGLVFQLTQTAGAWTQNILYNFGASPDGYAPDNGVIFDGAGNLYGTDTTGGTGAFGLGGTVYEIPSVTTANPTFAPGSGAYSSAQMVTLADATPNATIYYSINDGTFTPYSTAIEVAASETIQATATAAKLPRSQVATARYQIGTVAATPAFSPVPGTYTMTQLVALSDAAPGATIYYTTNGMTPTASSTKYSGPITVSSSETIEALAVATGYTNSPVASATYTIAPIIPPQEDLVYSFLAPAVAPDGEEPYAGLVFDTRGNMFGTTEYGGTHSFTYAGQTTTGGTVFELSPKAGGGWTEKVLYDFAASSTDGAHPLGGLVLDANGNLFGTTYEGGMWGLGTAFELSPGTGGTWTENVLHSFGGTLKDGEIPAGGMIFDGNGNLYGTTQVGGAYDTTYGGGANGFGTIFELSPGTGGVWTEKVLYSFSYLSETDGYYPEAGLIFDTHGNLYGTTSDGGSAQDNQGGGTVFELSPGTGGTWTETILCNFGGGSPAGYELEAGVVMDASDNLYGTAYSGGNGYGLDGLVFELTPGAGGTWTEKVLHSFGSNEVDGINPHSNLLLDTSGNLYGTTYKGGLYGSGMVYKLTPEAGGGWTESLLHSFDLAGLDGANPYAGLIMDSAGDLYGTTANGGANSEGAVYEIAPVPPAATLSAVSLTFGGQQTGTTSASQSVTLSNTGGSTLSISSIGVTGADASSFLFSNSCGTSLAEGASCTIHGHFTPAALGALTAAIKISDNAAGSPQSIALSGTGLLPPPALSATSLLFGSLPVGTTSASQSVTLTNSGSSAMSIASIAVTGADVSSFVFANNCGTSLAAGAICTIHGHFTPATTGVLTASVTITDNAIGTPQSVKLSGTGGSPMASLSAASITFASQLAGTTSASQSVTLTNTGGVRLAISSIAVTGTNASSFIFANTCGTGLAAGASCTIHGHFTPASVGVLTAAITISDNASGSPQSIALAGTGH